MYLEKVKNSIDEKFPSDWINAQIASSRPIDLFDFIESVHSNINLSILTGEYINDAIILPSLANALLDIMLEGMQNENKGDEIKNITGLMYYFFSLISQYDVFRNSLKHNLEVASYTISVPSNISIFHEEVESRLARLPYYNLKNYYKMFQLNLDIARIDHRLTTSAEQIQSLFSHAVFLKKDQNKNFLYRDCMLEKVYTLLQKIFRVLDHSDQHTEVFDGFDSTTDSILAHKVPSFSSFLDKSKYFDPSEVLTEIGRGVIKRSIQKLKSPETMDFLDFRLILRLIKSGKKGNATHLDVITAFGDFETSNQLLFNTFFDNLALKTLELYIKNNYLSFLIKSDSSHDEIQKLYLEILVLQEEKSVVNYFPHLKYSNYLLTLIESLIGDSPKNISLQIDTLLKELKEVSERLDSSFLISQEKRIIPFQAPFNECVQLVKTPYGEINLFLSSSYCLPLNFSTIKRDVESTKFQIEFIQVKVDMLANFKSVEKKLENANTQIKDTNKSQIEILSIFAAIVLFVASNIQLFPKFGSLKQALLFTISEAFSLGLFVMLIWFVTRGNLIANNVKHRFPWTHFWMFVLFAITTAILVVLILTQTPDIPLNNSPTPPQP